MNARTLIQFPNQQVITVANGDRKDFATLGEALNYIHDNGETVQQIGTMEQDLPNAYIVSVMLQFDHLLYTQGYQVALDYLTNEWNTTHPDVPLERSIVYMQEPVSSGPDTSTISSLDLAGMNPVLVGGLIIGVLYFMFKKKAS